MQQQVAAWGLISAPLCGLLLYRRIKTNFVRQPVRGWRMAGRTGLLLTVGAIVLEKLATVAEFGVGLTGVVLGIGLAICAVARTRLEATDAGTYFVPNRWIGGAVMVLFLGRFALRLASLVDESAGRRAPSGGAPWTQLTPGPLCFLVAYYAAYYVGILWRARGLEAVSIPTLAARR